MKGQGSCQKVGVSNVLINPYAFLLYLHAHAHSVAAGRDIGATPFLSPPVIPSLLYAPFWSHSDSSYYRHNLPGPYPRLLHP